MYCQSFLLWPNQPRRTTHAGRVGFGNHLAQVIGLVIAIMAMKQNYSHLVIV
jgi:hypothetical protein